MKSLNITALIYALIIAVVLVALGAAMHSWLMVLFSALCFLAAGYIWLVQRDLKKMSGQGKDGQGGNN